ncbi:hypothetical protein M406DRAFT_354137 [Cryphonectria parasitica EP155]|uniref:Vacuolar iron transporter Ccc1 n=1 Tax=Cryphonectria parasitica (strain ATCC 38755 / EP155) TaxID=660469 RepID=A0A9P4YBB4_CRYP1|nr:uncharacterized protein M406DRAFT_354137 [Cryphonectria parasitica EP155]KAF3769767.1 hypothetical protein M406DRAFT_354137 [Cryphonectria parasitica EP155]
MFDSLRRALRNGSEEPSTVSSSLPLYSPLAADTFESSSSAGIVSDSIDDLPLSGSQGSLKAAQRHAASSQLWLSRPSLSRFLADFTLGFADGLTVPFALTAGLSSLGQTDTVIYAGMAEICAGSISMGIGGYLSAKGEARASLPGKDTDPSHEDDDEEAGERCMDEKAGLAVDSYLAPLDLPRELLDLVRQHVHSRHDVATAIERKLAVQEEEDKEDEEQDAGPQPIMSGMSVALGYLIGGSLPLFPYFIVKHVGDGLLWSFIVCIIALFSFGFIKDFVLHMHKQREEVWVKDKGLGRLGWRWADVRRSSWEGTQMVMLGSMAALAAVFCVRLFDGMGYGGPEH